MTPTPSSRGRPSPRPICPSSSPPCRARRRMRRPTRSSRRRSRDPARNRCTSRASNRFARSLIRGVRGSGTCRAPSFFCPLSLLDRSGAPLYARFLFRARELMSEEGTPKTEMINPALLDGVSANFIVKGPSGVEKAYPMKSITVTIGRSDQCDISVKDSSMSGRHAEISKINGEIRVKDLGSANGIWLNGERVDEVELFDGDVLRLGQT